MIKVSVIVPCYNVENFLGKCLDSLVNQTLEDIEIICVNDCSPDNGLKLLRDYEAKYPAKMVVVDLEENVGIGCARNEGMKLARGEYIGFVDPDDWVKLDMYDQLYTIARERSADVLEFKFCKTESRSHDIENIGSGQITGGFIDDNFRKHLLINSAKLAWNRIYSASFIRKEQLVFPPLRYGEDLVWAQSVVILAKVFYSFDKVLYAYFRNPYSLTQKKDTNAVYLRLDSFSMLMELSRQRDWYLKYKDALDYFFLKSHYCETPVVCTKSTTRVNLDKICEIRFFMNKYIPDYRQNPRIKSLYSLSRTLASIMDMDSRLSVEFIKVLNIPFQDSGDE